MITDQFIHIHIPRTGGQLVRGICRQQKNKFKFFINNSHMTMTESLEELTKHGKNLKVPAFCVVRNPWDWYVSRYFFRQKEITRNKIGPQAKLEECGNSVAGFQKHMEMLRDYKERGIPVERILNRGWAPRIWKGLTLTDYFNYMCIPEPKHIIKLENFPNDMINLMRTLAPSIFDEKTLTRKLASKYNASQHDKYQDYYSEELRDMVADWDKDFIKRFEYEFGE